MKFSLLCQISKCKLTKLAPRTSYDWFTGWLINASFTCPTVDGPVNFGIGVLSSSTPGICPAMNVPRTLTEWSTRKYISIIPDKNLMNKTNGWKLTWHVVLQINQNCKAFCNSAYQTPRCHPNKENRIRIQPFGSVGIVRGHSRHKTVDIRTTWTFKK